MMPNQLPRFIAALAFAALRGLAPASYAGDAAATHAAATSEVKVVFQVSDNVPMTWKLALHNARNVQREFGVGRTRLEIVAYGPGVDMLKRKSPVAAGVEKAARHGAPAVPSANIMHAKKPPRNNMLASIGSVPSGAGQLNRTERKGYAYIRP